MLQRDGVEMVEMMVLVMGMMMMIPMKSISMTVTMAMIPPPGRNLPGRFLPAGELFSLCGFPPRSGGGIFLCSLPLYLGFSGDEIREGTMSEVGQGHHTMPRRGQGVARA
jgi:hypothetical protein